MLRGRIGDGGMGTVWEAEQDHPRRRVALKTIHPHKVSRSARRRFRFEAQAMGSLLHPGIPQVYAAGDDGGRLFLAMEKVEGQPLDAWVRATKPPPRQIVERMIRICEAVHHAHLRGIVHRDLKPANILVMPDGQPKVLDFGIAQALDGGKSARVSGTPAYMSPEQLLGGPVDVRTDVWSLGAVLFELLAGRGPLQVEGLTTSKLMWAVTSQPIPRLGEVAPAYAGDLDAIVGRALERDVDRRYGSARQLADELQRHLDHRPVLARPQTVPYRVSRWVRRNAGLSLALGLVVASLALGLAAVYRGYVASETARLQEVAQRAALQEALDRVEAEKARSEAVTEFLAEVFVQAHPDHSPGQEITVVEAMDAASETLDEGTFAEQPDVEVAVRLAMGWAYRGLSHDDKAVAMLDRAVALRPAAGPSTAGAQAAMFRGDMLRTDDNERSMALLAQAEADLSTLHPDGVHRDWMTYHHTAGRIHRAAGRFDEATVGFERALQLGDELQLDTPPTATWNQYGHLLRAVGRLEEAQELYARALEQDRIEWGDYHPQVATGLVNVGTTAAMLGKPEGLSMLREALAMRADLLGPDHRRTQNVRLSLLFSLFDAGEGREAVALLDEALASHGRTHDGALIEGVWFRARARAALFGGRAAEARDAAEQAIAWYTADRGADHSTTLRARITLAEAHGALGDATTARAVLDEAMTALAATVGDRAPEMRRAHDVLARLDAME